MTPPYAHISLQELLTAGFPHTRTVGQPGAQGMGVTGTQGAGVGVPIAAAVAAATAGFAGLLHIPKVVHRQSMIVAAGRLPIVTVCWLLTASAMGAVPKLQVHTAVATTGFAISSPPFLQA
jgi:hypothetical protein